MCCEYLKKKIKCGRDSVCVDAGKCISFSGRLCGRNVLVGKGLARTIVSDCGPRGKCMGGRCSIDSKENNNFKKYLNSVCEFRIIDTLF